MKGKIINFFIPDRNTKSRSRALRHEALLSYVFFIFALMLSSYLVILSVPNILGYATNINTSDLLNYTNTRRENAGLKSLALNSELSSAAAAKANDMFKDNYWAHTSPSGKEPWDFILAAGYDYLYAGENLAVDFSDSKNVVDAWYNSPSHKANLLNDKYTQIGFAVVNGELQGRKTTLVVQMFGYPRQVAAKITPKEPQIENQIAATDAQEEKPLLENSVESNAEDQQSEAILPQETQNNIQMNEIPEEIIVESLGDQTTEINFQPQGSVLNSASVFNASKFLAITFGLFLTIMFAIDGFYIKKFGILRISGHTIFHVIVLVLAIVAIWYTSIGLVL